MTAPKPKFSWTQFALLALVGAVTTLVVTGWFLWQQYQTAVKQGLWCWSFLTESSGQPKSNPNCP